MLNYTLCLTLDLCKYYDIPGPALQEIYMQTLLIFLYENTQTDVFLTTQTP